MSTRTERDAMGTIEVPTDRLWGAQTQRSLHFFQIGDARLTRPMIRALGLVKRAAATANVRLGGLENQEAAWITAAADEVIAGVLDDHFPLVVFQTGSGTQSNMNANEVIANRAIALAGGVVGSKSPIHPNDHVNRSQSSNDVFPTAMHIAAIETLLHETLPALKGLRDTLAAGATRFVDIVKVGRTHLQDATPLTMGQAMGAWVAQLDAAIAHLDESARGLLALAIGGTAVGTGLNAPLGFDTAVADEVARLTGVPFVAAPNKFAALASHDAIANTSAALRTVAGALMKIANDVRWLASGPRSGLGELRIPENEPGSSIMPGKVNPTQAEALTMVVCQVYGNDATIAMAASQGNFELNVYKPVMIHNLLQSLTLLAQASRSFDVHCAQGIEVNEARVAALLDQSLMLVTALAPHIGYDRAAQVAKHAHATGGTLREAAVTLGMVAPHDFDAWVDPRRMTQPG